MRDESLRLKLADDVTHQSMGPEEETVILSLRTGYLYTCNETTAEFIGALDGRRTFGEVMDAMTETFDVEREQLKADLSALIDELLREELLVEVAADATS